jgi:hypothetical protein
VRPYPLPVEDLDHLPPIALDLDGEDVGALRPSRVSAGAQRRRATIEATQCSPADLIIFLSTTGLSISLLASDPPRR